ncbi:MAG: ABC transporter ATP-binding protein [Caldilineaceae bacterium]|nr:ABC transporter ATP-binding protein [Caldilineaceae bacterium]
MMTNHDIILQVKDLHTHFVTESGVTRALSGVNFTVRRGQVLGIVGESGCGKSVTAQCIMNMLPSRGRMTQGTITYHRRHGGQQEAINITSLQPRGSAMRAIRGNEIAMIFQEPMTSLDPLYTVGSHLLEAITIHQNVTKEAARALAEEALAKVHLPEPNRIFDSYPHQLSGGQRQRVMIAIALSCNPTLLIADEPTTALDVTTQAQILDLMQELQAASEMSIIFITHDLGVVAEMCDEVAVMYLGKVVEKCDVDTAFYAPKHPYTKALLRSIPRLTDETRERLEVIRGNVPDPSVVPLGCPFHPRCPEFMPGVCNRIEPTMITLNADPQGSAAQSVRCLLYDERVRQGAAVATSA